MCAKTMCTEEDIRSLADYFGVSLDGGEYYLLPVIKAAVQATLPSSWDECHGDDGCRYYIHKK